MNVTTAAAIEVCVRGVRGSAQIITNDNWDNPYVEASSYRVELVLNDISINSC